MPVRSGHAFTVNAGQIVRFSTVDGPQVVDLNLWSIGDPRERFWAARTMKFSTNPRDHGSSPLGEAAVSCGRWSRSSPTPLYTAATPRCRLPRPARHALRPLRQSVAQRRRVRLPLPLQPHPAVAQFGLTEFDVHGMINLFQVTGLMPDDKRYFMKTCPARPGDYVELLAEIDLLMAISLAPAAISRSRSGARVRSRTELQSTVRRSVPARCRVAERMGTCTTGRLPRCDRRSSWVRKPADPPPPLTERVPVTD